jgi:hypothetical protein
VPHPQQTTASVRVSAPLARYPSARGPPTNEAESCSGGCPGDVLEAQRSGYGCDVCCSLARIAPTEAADAPRLIRVARERFEARRALRLEGAHPYCHAQSGRSSDYLRMGGVRLIGDQNVLEEAAVNS